MQLITVFNDSYPPKPLVTAIYDTKLEVFPLYLRGTKRSLFDVQKDIKDLTNRIELSKTPIVLNNAKAHIQAFGLASQNLHQTAHTIPSHLNLTTYQKLFGALLPLNVNCDEWRKTLGDSSRAYIQMESRPLFLDEIKVYPQYYLDTFSGRSRCCNYNVQGASVGVPLKTADPDEIFICCDWISADLRAAASLSGDKELSDTYLKSDPYTVLAEMLEIPRDECKLAFFSIIYSLDVESPILDLFPVFREWIKEKLKQLQKDGFLSTPLGRRFKLGKRDEKSVFNAVLQGTVAHAMQSSLAKMNKRLSEFLVTETHDSIILAAKRPLVAHVIKEAVEIMLKPLDKLPKFPLRVYIGKKWKQWKLYKEYR
jgi:hypothetical protein